MSPAQQLRDAAIVLNSLPEDVVSDVLARLGEDSRIQLMDSIDALETISGRELHQVSRRFRQQTTGSGLAERQALPTGTKAELWLVDKQDGQPFSFLKYIEADARRRLLEAEHPLNVAMVMTSLSPEFAAAVSRELDPPFRMSVMQRLCELDVVDDTKLMELRFELRMRAKKMLAIEHCTRRGLSVAADMLSLADQRTREGVLAWLADRDCELGQELRQRVMTMEDLADFSDEQIARLLKKVDTSAWAGALRSTVPSVVQRILQNMAPRAAAIVNAEIAAFDPLDHKSLQWSVEQVVSVAIKIRDQKA